ncbi:ParB/RepB/Spo0J family partition protein [Nostoc sp. LEGE 12447]|uniref:ParB/RepB/Spo0J family partition protein n=1 Tax=Nostoc sp. LEGE 12447 TaxID=1828640 RepID=UPI001883F030|nr:ParB/RepB/Spo0J family partition protein [Nostoc sp. LEGE 12447]MBE9003343.1 ParB/RepB/Spo0J family partition protein [Nostoc sp. LEGE 12447]
MSKSRRMVEDFIFRDEGQQSTVSIPLNSIVLPSEELRYYIDPEEVEKIVATARKNGILAPLLVRPIPGSDKHEVVAGAKRYRAAHILKLVEVPVVVKQLSNEEALEIALIENFARSGLTDLEEADGVLRLLSMKLNLPVAEVSVLLHRIQNQLRDRLATNNVIGENVIQVVQEVLASLGNIKLDSFISNRLPLLNLPSDILEVLRSGKLEASKAKAISRVANEDKRKELLSVAVTNKLSLNEIKQKIKEWQQSEPDSASLGESSSLQQRADETFRQLKKAKVWDDPKKKVRIEKLLAQLQALMKTD